MSPAPGTLPDVEHVTDVMHERARMICGMNPGRLNEPRLWVAYLWPRSRHWALVLRPVAGKPFTCRVVDDFAHNPRECFSAECPSNKMYLVFELLVHAGEMLLMLSVKPDFDPSRAGIQVMGLVGPMPLMDLPTHAEAVVRRYRTYSVIGCNCQHFAVDLAHRLGAKSRRVLPEDEAVASAAAENVLVVGASSVVLAASAAVGSAGMSMMNVLGGGAIMAVSSVLATVATTSLVVGAVGCTALLGLGSGYRTIYANLREERADVVDASDKAASDGASSGLASTSDFSSDDSDFGSLETQREPVADDGWDQHPPSRSHSVGSRGVKFSTASVPLGRRQLVASARRRSSSIMRSLRG